MHAPLAQDPGRWVTTTGLPDGLPPLRVLNDAGGVVPPVSPQQLPLQQFLELPKIGGHGLSDTWHGNAPEQAARTAEVEVGDRVLVESEKVGAVTRSGVVTAVEDRLITVRWDSGSESVFVPSAGSLQVTGHEPPQGDAGNP